MYKMLSSAQIQEIARRNGINPYYQEKDYLQNIFLLNLYQKGKDLVFKGGTCLKLAYNYPRFSEDLDFNSTLKPEKISILVRKTLHSFRFLGIKYEFMKEELFEDSYTSKIRFYGPFHSGRIESTNSIQIDAGKRDRVLLEPEWILVNSPYPDIPKYLVLAMKQEEILLEKIRALSERGMPRDLFDVWSMLNSDVKLQREILEKKLGTIELKLKIPHEKKYERDMGNLLATFPPYRQVIRDIKVSLKI